MLGITGFTMKTDTHVQIGTYNIIVDVKVSFEQASKSFRLQVRFFCRFRHVIQPTYVCRTYFRTNRVTDLGLSLI